MKIKVGFRAHIEESYGFPRSKGHSLKHTFSPFAPVYEILFGETYKLLGCSLMLEFCNSIRKED
jgi:hypothetical protein